MAMNPFFGNLGQGLQNNSDLLLQTGLGLLGGRNSQEQVAGAAQAVAGIQQRNKTLDFLKNTNPQLADAVASGALSPTEAYKYHMQAQLAAAKPKNNFIAVGKNLYDAENNQWVTPPAGSNAEPAEYGLQPQYGVDADGNPVLVQLSKTGDARTAKLPDGVKLSKEPIKLDAGTSFVLLDPITRQQIGIVPKDLAGAAQQTAEGKASGETTGTAEGALPAAKAAAKTVAQQVQDLKNDAYLPNMLGPINSRTPEFTQDAARVRGKINQLKGGAFLQARQLLKGGGAITDFEGQKAEQAYTRMEEAQSVEDFNRALDDFNAAVQQGVAILEQQAGRGAISPKGNRSSTGITWSVEP